MKKTSFLAGAVMLSGITAFAQNTSSSASQSIILKLNDAIEITFTGSGSNTGNDVTIPFNTVNDYANGVESATQELKVVSNRDFTVSVRSNAQHFSYNGTTSPSPVMPVSSVLGLMVTANTTGGTVATPFSTSNYAFIRRNPQDLIANGSRGSNQKFSIKYKATPGFTYPAGTYTVDVVYTATQN